MKYIIRKVPERNTEYLEKLLPEAEVFCDTEHKGAIYSFLKAIDLAKDDAVYVQDDMLLCKDFKQKAEAYITERKDSVIVFSTLIDKKGGNDPVTTEGFYKAREGGWLLCTYIPYKIARQFVIFMFAEQYKKLSNYKRFFKGQFDDILFCRFLDNFTDEKVFVTVPSLAGHNDNQKSVVNPKRPKRISPKFDYEGAEK